MVFRRINLHKFVQILVESNSDIQDPVSCITELDDDEEISADCLGFWDVPVDGESDKETNSVSPSKVKKRWFIVLQRIWAGQQYNFKFHFILSQFVARKYT